MTNHQPSLFEPAKADNSLAGFVNREAKRMWPSHEHRKRSIAQINKFIRFSDNLSRPLRHFLPRDVHEFADHLIDTGASEATVNRYLASISRVFNHAVDEQVIPSAPKLKFFKARSERIRYFSHTEIHLMLKFFNDRGDWWMADMVTLALKTGMRKGEIVALGEGTATITTNGDWIHLPASITKTGKERFVAISNTDACIAAHRLAKGLALHYSKRAFEYRWSLCKREYARDDDTFVFHVTRHTAASRMANELEVPTVIIAQALGHASLKTTQKYVHAKPDTLQSISERM